MCLVAWNCAVALHRKFGVLLSLRPDVAVIAECAAPALLTERLDLSARKRAGLCRQEPAQGAYRFRLLGGDSLATLALPGARATRWPPVRVDGPPAVNLLTVWAQKISGGIR
jgi:hypothetical protein